MTKRRGKTPLNKIDAILYLQSTIKQDVCGLRELILVLNPQQQGVSKTEMDKRKRKLKILFIEIDTDISGSIDRDEFKGYLIQIGPNLDFRKTLCPKNQVEEMNFTEFLDFMENENYEEIKKR